MSPAGASSWACSAFWLRSGAPGKRIGRIPGMAGAAEGLAALRPALAAGALLVQAASARASAGDRPRRVAGARCGDGTDYSIAGITRSGGLWPSTKVLMLMITFSPMSMRASSVAEDMCGIRTTFFRVRSLGFTAGSFS